MEQYPAAVGHLLGVALAGIDGPREVAIVGTDGVRRPLEAVVWDTFRPDVVVAAAEDAAASSVPLLEGRTTVDGRGTAYVCRGFVCDLPVSTPDELRDRLS